MVIFIAGIHGVGKTFLCQALTAATDLRHSSASQIIREERSSQSWGTDKLVADISGNQQALAAGVKRILEDEATLILDGHFVLKTSKGLEDVSLETFESLGLSAIILIESDVQVVAQRLADRDQNHSAGNLKEFMHAERMAALKASLTIGIPFFLLNSPSTETFIDCTNSILKLTNRNNY
ncbi:ATP-binding protein [Pseudomonas sp. TWP3-2]|uniref:ATP-binding protein n=1 Tax=Pseudomonas sp. TWP3-2 TaxID=2804574 RepID=UPI003CFAC974